MKKKSSIIIFGVLVVLIAALTGIYFLYIKKADEPVSIKKELYVCPMHPQIQSDHPGTCPICHMELVLKSVSSDSTQKISNDIKELVLSPAEQQLANVKTEFVELGSFDNTILSNGYVKQRDDAIRQVSSPIKGKISRLYANYEGQYISRGQKVFEIYSPELIASQREYLFALENYERVKDSQYENVASTAFSVLNAARERLKIWLITDNQIEEINRTRQIKNSLSFYSDYSGVITKKYYNEGSWIMEGTTIVEIVDLSSVWIMAYVYESELPDITKGKSADIIYSDQKVTRGKVDYINPFINPDTRTAEVRITVQNSNRELLPGAFLKVKFYINRSVTSLAVSKTAIIRTGKKDIAYIKKEGNTFIPVEVNIISESNDKYLITGLKEGDEIVVSAGFLLDSESQIRNSGSTASEKKNDMEIKDKDVFKDLEHKNH